MPLSTVFKYRPMAKQAVDCRNMVRVKVWYTHTTVWLGYSKITVNVF